MAGHVSRLRTEAWSLHKGVTYLNYPSAKVVSARRSKLCASGIL